MALMQKIETTAPVAATVTAPVSAPVAAPVSEVFYRVTAETSVPRGASSFLLPAGKVISSRGYDIAELKRLGVPLTDIAVIPGVNPNPVRATVAV